MPQDPEETRQEPPERPLQGLLRLEDARPGLGPGGLLGPRGSSLAHLRRSEGRPRRRRKHGPAILPEADDQVLGQDGGRLPRQILHPAAPPRLPAEDVDRRIRLAVHQQRLPRQRPARAIPRPVGQVGGGDRPPPALVRQRQPPAGLRGAQDPQRQVDGGGQHEGALHGGRIGGPPGPHQHLPHRGEEGRDARQGQDAEGMRRVGDAGERDHPGLRQQAARTDRPDPVHANGLPDPLRRDGPDLPRHQPLHDLRARVRPQRDEDVVPESRVDTAERRDHPVPPRRPRDQARAKGGEHDGPQVGLRSAELRAHLRVPQVQQVLPRIGRPAAGGRPERPLLGRRRHAAGVDHRQRRRPDPRPRERGRRRRRGGGGRSRRQRRIRSPAALRGPGKRPIEDRRRSDPRQRGGLRGHHRKAVHHQEPGGRLSRGHRGGAAGERPL
mmetsp:Transcript_1304/g.3189  ORF Transcript_1304/g.3189 Transcript_1304/m.3189 type:complete len:440 (+) Transcript_1304:498-1817(+)